MAGRVSDDELQLEQPGVVEAIVSVGIRGAVMTGDACLLLQLTKPLVDGQAL